MKVLIYSRVFLPVTGGIQTVVSELARGLADRRGANGAERIEVTVVTRTKGGMDNHDSLPYKLVRDPNLLNLIEFVREADVIHVAGPAMLPIALGLLFRKPLVVEHHDTSLSVRMDCLYTSRTTAYARAILCRDAIKCAFGAMRLRSAGEKACAA